MAKSREKHTSGNIQWRTLPLTLILILLLFVPSLSAEKVNYIWSGFQAGELSPWLDGQVGLEEYRFGAKTMTNFIPYAQGPAAQRSGFKYIASTKTANETSRLIPFEFSTTQAYVLEFGDQYIRYYMNGGQIYSVPSTTVLLLESNGTDADTSFSDSSPTTPHTITSAGNAQIDTAYKKFGTGAGLYDGLGDYLTISDDSDFDVSDESYSINAWVRPNTSGTLPYTIYSQRTDADNWAKLYLDTYVSLLLHFDGSDGSTTFTDSSAHGHSWTVNGDAQIDSGITQTGFGQTGLFDGTGDCLTKTDDDIIDDLSSNIFTISMWVRFSTLPSVNGAQVIIQFGDSAPDTDMRILSRASDDKIVAEVRNSATIQKISSTSVASAATWYHVEFASDGSKYYLFINGTLQNAGGTTISQSTINYDGGIGIGAFANCTINFYGSLDDLRIINGKALHTSDFTAPTSPYDDDTLYPAFELRIGASTETLLPDNPEEGGTSLNEWGHVELSGDGTSHYLFAKGTLLNSGGTNMTNSVANFTQDVHIGGHHNNSSVDDEFAGHVDELRVSTISGHTASFTPNTVSYQSQGTTPYETVTTYTEEELTELQFAQSADTLYIVHPDHAPAQLTRTAHATWTLSDVEIVNRPTSWATGSFPSSVIFFEDRLWFAYYQTMFGSQAGDYTNFIPNEAGSTETVAAANWTTGTDLATVANNTGTWITGFKVQLTTSAGDLPNGLATSTDYYIYRSDSTHVGFATSAANAYAGTLADFDDQGSGDHTITLQDSCTGDACAMEYTIASNNVNSIQWLSSGKILVAGTSGGEYKVSASTQDDALTPTNIRIIKQSSYGSDSIMPLTIRDVVLYVQRAARKVREFTYRFENDTYVSPDLTLLAEHITESGIKYLDFQDEPHSIVWAVKDNGNLIGMTYARENNTVAWHEHTTDGDFESIAVISSSTGNEYEEVWVIVEREIGGSDVRYVEQLQPQFGHNDSIEDAFFVDSGLSYDGVATTTISGLDHLEGETVSVLADGVIHDDEVVSSGSITLDSAATKVHAGLPYTATLQTMRYSGAGAKGTSQGQEKRIPKVVMRLENALTFQYGHDASGSLNTKTFSSMSSGDYELTMPLGVNREGYVAITNSQPTPLTVIAIIPEVNTN